MRQNTGIFISTYYKSQISHQENFFLVSLVISFNNFMWNEDD